MTIRKMEGGSPSPFVKERGEIVVAVDQVGVVGVAFGGRGRMEAFVFGHGGGDGGGRGEISLFLRVGSGTGCVCLFLDECRR